MQYSRHYQILACAAALSALVGCGTRSTSLPRSAGVSPKGEIRSGDVRPAVLISPLGETLRSKEERSPQTRGREVAPSGMVWIPAGTFQMGGPKMGPQLCDPVMPASASGDSKMDDFTDAQPAHAVTLDGFYMDATDVTNAQFAKFVHATGYVTVAERPPDPKLFPGVPPDKLVPGAVVFSPPPHPVPLTDVSQWWRYVPGANWKHPQGPKSDLTGLEDHPVVEVCWDDAAAYARWAGKRLPTEAEWEYAARGGLKGKPYVWGDTMTPHGHWMANTFQGHFPDHNADKDGYPATSPVRAFPPNGYGLYDMAGNVWQWCADWYRQDYYTASPAHDPQGPAASLDPDEPAVPKRVQRGGSYLCTDQYCSRYLVGTRGKGDPLTGTSHAGFRCVVSTSAAAGVRPGL